MSRLVVPERSIAAFSDRRWPSPASSPAALRSPRSAATKNGAPCGLRGDNVIPGARVKNNKGAPQVRLAEVK